MSESNGPERAANPSRCPFAALASGRKTSSVEPEPEPAIGLAQMLKEGTASLHDQAEHAAFQTRMVKGELSRAEFIDFLNQVIAKRRSRRTSSVWAERSEPNRWGRRAGS